MGLEQIKVELVSYWGGDRDAANAAWASSTDLEKLEAKSASDVMRVVTGIVHNHHDTPKERLWLEFFITCPIFVERQFDKYRMTVQYQQFNVEYMEAPMGRNNITQNELSGRYRTIPDRPYYMPDDVSRILNKGTNGYYNYSIETFTPYSDFINSLLDQQHNEYQSMLLHLKVGQDAGKISNQEYKRVREVIRGMLGTSFLTDMRIVMNMNAFEHIVNQRLARDAQLESRIVADLMIGEVAKINEFSIMLSEMIKVNKWDELTIDLEKMLNATTDNTD